MDYLLNPRHSDAAGKAAFFMGQGFTVEAWEIFADALRRLAAKWFVHYAYEFSARNKVHCGWTVGDAGREGSPGADNLDC